MRTNHKILMRLEIKSRQHIRDFYLRQIVVEYFIHWTAGLNNLSGRKPLSKQMLARNAAIRQIDVRHMVNDSAIGLFGDALIEAPIACLHVKDRDLAPLGGDHREAAVGVA